MGFFVVLVPLLGWLRLKGQYELGWYDTPFGLALMAAMIMVVGIALVWWTSTALDRTDSWRAALQEDLAASVSREHGTAAQRGAILNALPAAIALLGSDGRVIAVNQRWASLAPSGTRCEDPLGRLFVEWAAPAVGADSEGWSRIETELRALLIGESPGQVVAVRATPAGGGNGNGGNGSTGAGDSWRWLEVRIAPVASVHASRGGLPHKGPPSGAVVMVSDVTEQRRLEEQLVHSQRLEAVGRLAGGVAHDFNNLLTAVLGHASLARDQERRLPEIAPNLAAIEQAARSGAELTQQLLAFGRRQVLSTRTVHAGEIVANVRRLIERSLGDSVRLQVNIDNVLWPIKVDAGRIEQVVMNLVINARDAIPPGKEGGMVMVEASNAVLDQAYAAARPGTVTPGDYVCISVSDNGTGMTPEIAARVFEPFFTTKERGKGTGLGLATSFGIVKQHGGHITLYTEPGAGSTFRVFLPAAAGSTAEPRHAAGVPAPRGTERVLLVDDHEGARGAVAGMLRALGYLVTEAADAAQARRLVDVERGRFDLVVCDVMLPDGTGPEVMRQLTATEPWNETPPPVLYISGYTANAVVNHGTLDPGLEFIAKPFSADELGIRVRSLLDRGRAAPVQL
ncbi:MAG: ATP-binding protein [Phycisphaerales bacterium]